MLLVVSLSFYVPLFISLPHANAHPFTDSELSNMSQLLQSAIAISVPLLIDTALDYFYSPSSPFLQHRLSSLLSLVTPCVLLLTIESNSFAKLVFVTALLWSFFMEFSILSQILFRMHTYFNKSAVPFGILGLLFFSLHALLIDSLFEPGQPLLATISSAVLAVCTISTLILATHWFRRQYVNYVESKLKPLSWCFSLTDKIIVADLILLGVSLQLIIIIIVIYSTSSPFNHGWVQFRTLYTLLIFRTIFCLFSYFISARLFRNKLVRNHQDLAFKTELIKYFSHEMRSPIMVMSVGLELVDQALQTSDPQIIETALRDNISDIHYSCAQSLEILDNMLLYEKLETSELRLEQTCVEPVDGIKEVLEGYRQMARRYDVDIHLKFSAREFEGNPLKINVDASKLKLVFDAMLSSAFSSTNITNAGGVQSNDLSPSRSVPQNDHFDRIGAD